MAYTDPLKDVSNVEFLNRIREDSTASYQQRINVATQANIAQVVEQLYNFQPLRNEFTDALVNRIGATIGRNMIWENPMAMFKDGKLSFGDTVEEYAVGLLQSHTYSSDRDYMEKSIWGQEQPESRSIFHKINRQDYYKVTINDRMLRRAFLEENGLGLFTTKLMSAPVTSDNLDEFLIMCNLIAEYEKNGGFYHMHVDDLSNMSSTTEQAQQALRKLRTIRELMKFPSTKYNAAKMPSFANPDELVFLTTPAFKAAMDVNALAGAFNMSYMEFDARTFTIPPERFGITGAQAILTTQDFWRVFDTRLETTSQFNPVGLYSNYFLHHQGIYSVNLFVPAVLLYTGPDDESINITVFTPTGVTLTMQPDNTGATVTTLYPGGIYGLSAAVVTSPAGGNIPVIYTVSGNNDPNTYVTRDGVLHVSRHETATTVTVTATTASINPDDPFTNGATGNLTTPSIDQSTTVEWPITGIIGSITVMGVSVAAVDPSTTSYNVTVPALPTSASDVVVTLYGGANVTVAVAATTGVVTITVDGSVNTSPVTYTVTPTVG